jgi:hypothetical protein
MTLEVPFTLRPMEAAPVNDHLQAGLFGEALELTFP